MDGLDNNMIATGGCLFNLNESLNESDSFSHQCDVQPHEFNVIKSPVYIGIVIVTYSIVILSGALGNTLVVVTIAKTRKLWNATNIFIASLAFADILVCLFDLPLNAYYNITDDWIFGRALCHVIPMIFAVVVYASSLSLTMIAIDRYILIVFPLKRRMTNTVAMLFVVAIVIVSVSVASPIGVFAKYVEHNDEFLGINWRFCGEKWPNKYNRKLYTIITLALQFVVPLIVIGILYWFIFKKVAERMATACQRQSQSRKAKTTKMLVAVVTIFAITWIPFHLFALISEFNSDLITNKYYKFVDSMLRVVAMSSSCINPILYGWMNDNYRNAFLNLIHKSGTAPRGIHHEESEMPKAHQIKQMDSPLIKSAKSPNKKTGLQVNGNGNVSSHNGTPEETIPLHSVSSSQNNVTKITVLDDSSNKPDTSQSPKNGKHISIKDNILMSPSAMSASQSPLLKSNIEVADV